MELQDASGALQPRFETTRWSMIVAAGDQDDDSSSDALAELCQRYWMPLYAFVRRSGYQTSDAQDLTQTFFERLIERRFIAAADADRGRFRTFVLAALKNFMSNEWKKASRIKRGGGSVMSMDFAAVENGLFVEPIDGVTPESLFDREWAVRLLDRVLERLSAAYTADGNGNMFEALRPYLTVDSNRRPYEEAAERHGMTVGQIKVNVHRLRTRYRALLEEEIAHTVSSADQVEDEVRGLFAALQ